MVKSKDTKERSRQNQRLSALTDIRRPRYEHWQDITKYIVPYSGSYMATERDQRVNRFQDLIDETGPQAVRTLTSGMMTMRTNPTLPWFRSQTPDPDLNLYRPARQWLFKTDQMARRILHKSRSYVAIPHLYRESSTFGTGASIVVDDFDTIIHHYKLTAGEYLIAQDARGHVNTLYREFRMSVAEIVREFGIENVSDTVKNMFESGRRGSIDSLVPVVHAIEPRSEAEREPGKRDATNMPWKSVYFEANGDHDDYLRISGYKDFRCVVPRWEVNGGDVWGEGPGTMALGSVRELQESQLIKARVMDHHGNPSLQIPPGSKGRDRDLFPGGRFPYDQNSPYGGVRNTHEVPLRLDIAQSNIEDIRARINKSYYVDLFQPITAINDSTQRTARETDQRATESLTVLGPVTIQLNGELDEALLNIIYGRMFEENLLPSPPPELNGMPIDIEFIGPLAQALKNQQAEVNSRFRMHLGEIAAFKPNAVDKYDADADVDRISDMLGVDPSLIVSGEQVALIRQAQAEAEKASAQMEAMSTQASTAKDMAAAGTTDQSVLTDMMAGASG